MLHALLEDRPQLLDAPAVQRVAEARPQAPAGQAEPEPLVVGRAAPATRARCHSASNSGRSSAVGQRSRLPSRASSCCAQLLDRLGVGVADRVRRRRARCRPPPRGSAAAAQASAAAAGIAAQLELELPALRRVCRRRCSAPPACRPRSAWPPAAPGSRAGRSAGAPRWQVAAAAARRALRRSTSSPANGAAWPAISAVVATRWKRTGSPTRSAKRAAFERAARGPPRCRAAARRRRASRRRRHRRPGAGSSCAASRRRCAAPARGAPVHRRRRRAPPRRRGRRCAAGAAARRASPPAWPAGARAMRVGAEHAAVEQQRVGPAGAARAAAGTRRRGASPPESLAYGRPKLDQAAGALAPRAARRPRTCGKKPSTTMRSTSSRRELDRARAADQLRAARRAA